MTLAMQRVHKKDERSFHLTSVHSRLHYKFAHMLTLPLLHPHISHAHPHSTPTYPPHTPFTGFRFYPINLLSLHTYHRLPR